MNLTLPVHRALSATALLVAGAALLAGCGSSSSSAGGGSTTPSTTTTSSPTSASGGGQMVHVTLENFKIIVAGGNTLKAGTYTFAVNNKGPSDHNLTINGPGVAKQATPTFPPGQTQNLTVTLKNGMYAFYCSVPGHRQLGMDVSVKVGTGGGSSSGTASSGGTSSSGGGWS